TAARDGLAVRAPAATDLAGSGRRLVGDQHRLAAAGADDVVVPPPAAPAAHLLSPRVLRGPLRVVFGALAALRALTRCYRYGLGHRSPRPPRGVMPPARTGGRLNACGRSRAGG